jgi:hypothetical protein
MEIKPTYVTFEQSKALKQKGFDEKVHQYYQFIRNKSSKLDKTWQFVQSSFLVRESDAVMCPDKGKNGIEVYAYSDRIFRDYNFKNSEDFISVPEQWQVIEWLRINHGIWVYVKKLDDSWLDLRSWIWVVRKQNNSYPFSTVVNSEKPNDCPQEAYSAAFDYVLKNLI